MTEQKIRQMQAEVAMLQTARQAYASALKASLVAVPPPEVGETFKF